MSELRDTSGGATKAVVTTPDAPTGADVRQAKAEAQRLGLAFVGRGRHGLGRVFAESGAQVALVVGARETVAWVAGSNAPLRFHGGMGVLRAKGVTAGRPDPLMEACGVRRGDTVVDATAGRCSDALVAEATVGPEGKVIAIESSPLVHAVMSRGLRGTGSAIELVLADHHAWLRAQPARSVDVIYFDPMFRAPGRATADFEVFRGLAHPTPLERETLDEAARVARRRVLLVDGTDGAEIRRLGLTDVSARWSARRFGVLEIAGG